MTQTSVFTIAFDQVINKHIHIVSEHSTYTPFIGKVKGDPCVNDLRCLKYDRGRIFYKLSFADFFKIIPQKPINRDNYLPKKMYKQRLPVSYEKFKDLQDLKYVLPENTHQFYNDLPHLPRK